MKNICLRITLSIDRDLREQLFKFNEHICVCFAVDPDEDELFMNTKLDKDNMYFLLFDKGNNSGKGNPLTYDRRYSTHYLWGEIFVLDILLDMFYLSIFIEKNNIF